jgi:hypothetical protein
VVSDQFRDLISLLPSMRPGEAFIIGDAVMMPMRTLIDLPPKTPQSADMDFFGRWSEGSGEANTEQIIDRWWRQDRSALNANRRAANEDGDIPPRADAGRGSQPAPPKTRDGRELTPAERQLAELAAMLNAPSE